MLVFRTPGLIDLRAIKTFGVSAKLHNDAIGRFGTGLKYAISIFLRLGYEVELLRENKRHIFGLKNIEMRDKSFSIVTMNDEELPFTTHLGAHWDIWQAFRELYCNTLDEKGTIKSIDEAFFGDTSNESIFIVRGPETKSLYLMKDSIVLNLNEKLLLASDGHTKIYDMPSKHLYYRGIRVMDFSKPSLFTYNIVGETEITEDRTLKNVSYELPRIAVAIAAMKSKRHIRSALIADENYTENMFQFYKLETYDHTTAEFLEVLAEEFQKNNDSLNYSARNFQQKRLNKTSPKNFERAELNQVQANQLKRAQIIISSIYKDFGDYQIQIVKNLGQTTMGLADYDTNTMVISLRCFDLGTKYLTSTLIEEFFHLKTGYMDESRNLQTYLFDQLSTMIETYVVKEPI